MPSSPYDERSALPLIEQTLLWSMRTWVAGLRTPSEVVVGRMAAVFADLGAPACAGYIDGFMWVLRHGAARTIGIDCPCCPRLERDERVLLRVFALMQQDDWPVAAALLQGMVTPNACNAALDSAGRVGAELLRAKRRMGARLPRPASTWSPSDEPSS